jgi:hypothetical protein
VPRSQRLVPFLAGGAVFLFVEPGGLSPGRLAIYVALGVYLSQLASEHLLYRRRYGEL